MPSLCRVNCTADASARNSLCLETAALIMRAKNIPIAPRIARPSPMMRITGVPRSRRLTRFTWKPLRIIIRPISDSARMPNNTPIMRIFRRMSPFRMWLNSCAMTPCNSSRFSSSSVPRVTAIAASPGVKPAANAFIPLSSSSTYTSGTGTPEAIAISSTTLRNCRRKGSLTSAGISVPPNSAATRPPPDDKTDVL